MGPTLITGPTAEPVTIQEAKDHCRVEVDTDNAWLMRAVRRAREQVEKDTRRQIMSATYDLILDKFPSNSYRNEFCHGNRIWLPFPPLQSVTSITYTNEAGTPGQVLAASNYKVDLTSLPGQIALAFNATWPSAYAEPNVIAVRFVCGYSVVPESLNGAILMLVAHWYENRAATEVGIRIAPIPLGYSEQIGDFVYREAA